MISPLKQSSFKLNKWWKATQSPSHVLRVQHISGGIYFKTVCPWSHRNPMPSRVLTTKCYLMLTMLRNSISPCLNTALPVTSTVNQGRTPLLQDKIREVCNAQQWFNPLWTGQNWPTAVFGDHHHLGQILRPPLEPNLSHIPKGSKVFPQFW